MTNSFSVSRYLILLTLLAAWLFSAHAQANSQQSDGSFYINHKQTRLMQFENLRRVDIGDPKVVSISLEPGSNHFIINGLAPGKTDITLWGAGERIKRYVIRVRGDKRVAEKNTLDFLLGNIDGALLMEDAESDSFFISGTAVSTADYERLTALASRYDNVIINAEKPAFDQTETVRMRIRFLEISTAALRHVGVDWNNLVSGFQIGVQRNYVKSPFNENQTNTRYSIGLDTPLSTAINILVQNGKGRVLKEQSLLVQSGSTGNIFTGGQFPVASQSGDGVSSTEYRPFGMTLEVNPVVNRADQIHSSLKFEMSSLDLSLMIGGNPVLHTTRQETQLIMKNKQAIIIGDFVGSEDAKTVRKVPGLGHIPVFGEFFKSRNIQRERIELLILLEPEIIDTGLRKHEELTHFNNRSDAALKATQFNILD